MQNRNTLVIGCEQQARGSLKEDWTMGLVDPTPNS